jgi:hypothetical protein
MKRSAIKDTANSPTRNLVFSDEITGHALKQKTLALLQGFLYFNLASH